MNTKIKELANKAGIQLDYFGVGYCADGGNPDVVKFAELIIKECAGIYEAIDNGNKIEGTDNYIKALRIRFGI